MIRSARALFTLRITFITGLIAGYALGSFSKWLWLAAVVYGVGFTIHQVRHGKNVI